MPWMTFFVVLGLGAAPGEVESALAARVVGHIERLASDDMEGRAPGTPGGDRAARYIASELEAMGLATSLQPVPLVGHRSLGQVCAVVEVDGRAEPTLPNGACVLSSDTAREALELVGDLVFVGYGVGLPEADVRGRLLALLPGVPEHFPGGPNGPLSRDGAKLEAARLAGARGVVFLQEDIEPRRESLRFERLTKAWFEEAPLEIRGDVVASALVPPERLAALEEEARHSSADAAPLGVRLRVAHRQRVRRFTAPNVVAVLPGRDSRAGVVLVTAHYDAYGVGPPDEDGDAIYNGALDNAAGSAALLEIARLFASRERPLRRTLVFVATTAEERGKLGMSYYLEHPKLPLADTVVALNIDGLNVYGATEDFYVFPSEGTSAAPALRRVGERVGMRLERAAWQVKMHFAFDTAPLFERGLVGLTLWQGTEYRGLSAEAIQARLRRFGPIHGPSDEWPGSGDRQAIAQHVGLYVAAIEHWAEDAPAPELLPAGPLVGK